MADCSGNNRFKHRAAGVVQQVDFVNDHEGNFRRDPALRLPRNNVPLFRGANNNLRVSHLLLAELMIPSKFVNLDAVRSGEPISEVTRHFGYQRLHRRNVNHFKPIQVEGSVFVAILTKLAQNCTERDIRLACPSRRAKQDVLVLSKGRGIPAEKRESVSDSHRQRHVELW